MAATSRIHSAITIDLDGLGTKTYCCSLCKQFRGKSYKRVLSHIGSVHSYDPNFCVMCGIEGCTRTYAKYDSFRKHIQRSHPEASDPKLTGVANRDGDNMDNNETSGHSSLDSGVCDEDSAAGDPTTNPMKSSALFLLKAKEVHKVSQIALDEMTSDFAEICKTEVTNLQAKVDHCLRSNGIEPSDIPDLQKVFTDSRLNNPFCGLNSAYRQDQFFKENLQLVSPIEYKLGRKMVQVRRGARTRWCLTWDSAYVIPLLSSLKQLLNNESVLAEVLKGHQKGDDIMEDYVDGSVYKHHPLFSVDPTALQIMLYYDDVEVVNPLGSKTKKHKLALFYYMLGNISPKYRSSLKSIQLVAVAKSKDVSKYGIDCILKPFMEHIQAMESEEGVSFSIQGNIYNFRGTLTIVSADNPASHALGGYKSLTSALRKCRFCMATNLSISFFAEDFQSRTRATHALHCSELQGPNSSHAATTYGVQRNTILHSSKFFHITEGLPMDIMHDILEGVLQYEVKEMLKVFKLSGILSLKEVNEAIEAFPYGYADINDKPSSIADTTLTSSDNSLKQKAAQMWCLARYLPLMIGKKIPEMQPHWQNFLLMLTITDYVFAPTASVNTISYLHQIIHDHHTSFTQLYPTCSITPKMHYMIHIPEWISRCGPISRHWCMRFEAKHNYFKSLAQRVKCFKNIAKTLASRHQKLMCYYLSNPLSSMIIKGMKTSKGVTSPVGDYQYKSELKGAVPTLDDSSIVTSMAWIELQGTTYKRQAFIVTESLLLPQFACITDIVLIPGDSETFECYFVCSMYDTIVFSSHYHAYEIVQVQPLSLLAFKPETLADHHALTAHQLSLSSPSLFISLKYHIIEDI